MKVFYGKIHKLSANISTACGLYLEPLCIEHPVESLHRRFALRASCHSRDGQYELRHSLRSVKKIVVDSDTAAIVKAVMSGTFAALMDSAAAGHATRKLRGQHCCQDNTANRFVKALMAVFALPVKESDNWARDCLPPVDGRDWTC